MATPSHSWSPPAALGAAIRREEFSLDPNVTFINHAAYGTIPNKVRDAQTSLQAEVDSVPDMLFQRNKWSYLPKAVQKVADFFGTSSGNIALVENVTRGCNDVLKSVPVSAGDAFLVSNWTYPAVANIPQAVRRTIPGVEVVCVDFCVPINSVDDVIDKYRKALDENPNIKVVIIDHISSKPALLWPVKELVALCRERNVLCLVDGAHCPGQLKVNLDELQPDFYVGNIHKWMYSARGCAILYVAPRFHSMIKPAVTSFKYEKDFPECFQIAGTRDETSILTVGTAIEFFDWIGGWDAASTYNRTLLEQGVDILLKGWKTEVFQVPREMHAPYIRDVKVPDMQHYEKTLEGSLKLYFDLYDRHRVLCMITVTGGDIYFRVCANVYCMLADYETFRDAVLALKGD